MRNVVIHFLCLPILLACVGQKISSPSQGIVGEIRWLEGNLMPTIGDTSYVSRAEGVPVQREIHIYKAVNTEDTKVEDGTFFTKVNSELVKKIKSDKVGKFRVLLPVGCYSLFVLEKGRLYANTFDGGNLINPVTVEHGKFAEIKISINYQAYY